MNAHAPITEIAYAQVACPRCGLIRWARAGAADCGSSLCGVLAAPQCDRMDEPLVKSVEQLEYDEGDQ